MECIYAHHQIVFLYFLLGENVIKQQPQHFFSSSFPWLKKQILKFYPSKGGCERALQDFSVIEKPGLKNF